MHVRRIGSALYHARGYTPPVPLRRIAALVAGVVLTGTAGPAAAAGLDLLIELHYKPIPNLQIAIWLEDNAGAWTQDVLVTQATGKLGIGNRPGLWNFPSSWRAPYGPRPSVLPVWAHRRGKTYPKLIFFDSETGDHQSLGWHENSSTAENYFCRPLTPEENTAISVDTMTCPSPAGFNTDKGRFDPDATSVYPPRNDLLEFDGYYDSPDAAMFAALNDLDAVTAATPSGAGPEYTLAIIPAATAERGPFTAYIEVSREHDENAAYDFDREDDHAIDPRLESYGVEYLGQPSVVYRVAFDPKQEGFVGTLDYAGHGDWDGATGTLHPPSPDISDADGSGSDRLREYSLHGETFRFGVYSYGADGKGGDDGWGHCEPTTRPAISDLVVEPIDFDRARVSFTVPKQSDPEFALTRLNIYLLPGTAPLTADNLGAAQQRSLGPADAGTPGEPLSVEVDQLFGDFTYQVGVVYTDKCANPSALVTAPVTTPAQKFQQVEGFCFLATAAYGAAWVAQVQALRWFRDAYLERSALGRDVVRFSYTYSPPLARVVRRQPVLRGMVRTVVGPLADLVGKATPGPRG
jgi:hypothetical protein